MHADARRLTQIEDGKISFEMPLRTMNVTRLTKGLLWAGTMVPIVWLVCFYWLVLRTRELVGHWPYYAHPDPKDTGFDTHHILVLWGMLGFPVFGLAMSIFGFVMRRKSHAIPWWLVGAPFAMALAVVIYLNVEPRHFVEWLLD